MSDVNLALTSPFTRGPHVVALQKKLRSAGFLFGAADGVLGPETARSFRTGKFWLGYPIAVVEGHGGEIWGPVATRLLDDLLAKRTLPKPYSTARAARLHAKQEAEKKGATLRERTLAAMVAHACPAPACTESPAGSNRVPWASGWYGVVGPWCAMGFTRCAVDSGSRSFAKSERYSYVPTIVHDAAVGLNGLHRIFGPLPGHGVCYDWTGDGIFDHVEAVSSPPRSLAAGTPFKTVGCNTSSNDHGSQSNGGGCFHRDRVVLPSRQIVFFSYA